MPPIHKCTQEANISFITKSYAGMDKKIDTVITEIKDMRKEIKDTYATKEELDSAERFQHLENATMRKDLDKLSGIIDKLAWVVVIGVMGGILAQVIK